MKIKQKLTLYAAITLGLVMGAFSPLYSPTASALSEQGCYDKYDGIEKTYSKRSDYDNYLEKFKDDECGRSQGGNCTADAKFISGSGSGSISISCKEPATPGGATIDGCKSISTSIIKCDTKQDNPILSIILQVVNFLAVGVGIAVAGGITWGGFMYSQANGNSSKTLEAVHIVTNSVIGLLLFIFMYALLNWLIPGGLFN